MQLYNVAGSIDMCVEPIYPCWQFMNLHTVMITGYGYTQVYMYTYVGFPCLCSAHHPSLSESIIITILNIEKCVICTCSINQYTLFVQNKNKKVLVV